MNPLDDFRNFLYLVWQHLGLPEPTPVQYDIAHYMQHGPRRCVIEAYRGVGKSFIAGAFTTFDLYHTPQEKFLVPSASKDRADAFSIFVKRLIAEMPLLKDLRPRADQRDSNIAFDVGPATNDQSPSVKSVGITGQITGSRADKIIPDDVESLNNSATHDQRQKLGERIKEFDAVLKPGGRIIYLGTPQTEHSIYRELEARGYEIRVWPARYPDAAARAAYGDRLAPFIVQKLDSGEGKVGTSVDPKRFTDLDLVEREASYGRSGFALQFMLDTRMSDRERYPLKLSDLTVMGINPDMAPAKVVWANTPDCYAKDLPNVGLDGDKWLLPMETIKPWGEYTGSIMFIDPSGRGSNETGYAVVKVRNGLLYLTAAGGYAGGYDPATMTALANIALRQKVNTVVIETNFGDGMWASLFTPYLTKVQQGEPTWQCGVEEVRASGQKEKRIIDTLEPVMNQHRLIVDEKLVRADFLSGESNIKRTLFYQLTRITQDRGSLPMDDRIDALAGAVEYWVEALARDVDTAVRDSETEKLDKDLEDFMEMCLGRNRPEKTWVTN